MGKFKAGKDVAKLFPWWQTGVIDLTDIDYTNGARFAFHAGGLTEGQRAEPYLRNDQPGPVAITEVRFWSNQPYFNEDKGVYLGDFLDAMVVQMETDLRQGLIEEWMPVKALHTEVDTLFAGRCTSGYMRLPSPYFVQAANQFQMTLKLRQDIGANLYDVYGPLAIQLRGRDPLTRVPIARNMRLDVPMGPGVGGPPWVTYSLDDNRDAPVRDLEFQEIAFGATAQSLHNGVDYPNAVFDPYEVKFHPPEGPSWTKDPYTHLYQGLFEQVGVTLVSTTIQSVVSRRPVIHRPMRPYVLRPGDSFRIRAMFDGGIDTRGDPTYPATPHVEDAQNLIFCRISGVQEGTDA